MSNLSRTVNTNDTYSALNTTIKPGDVKSSTKIAANQEIQPINLKGKNAAEELFSALKNNRFAILDNHDVTTELLPDLYSKWGEYFSSEKKLASQGRRSDIDDEGYVPLNTEKAVGNEHADIKEYYQTHHKGAYPDFIDCQSTKQLINELVSLGEKVTTLIDQIIPESIKKNMTMALSEMINDSDRHGFRVIHYPGMNEVKIPPRAGEHTDICIFTIIPTATAEGLELQDSNGNWHNPKIKKSHILIFSGDMLEMATNGYLPATMHRVTTDPETNRSSSRFSLPVFIHPRREVELKPGIKAIDALRVRLTEIGFNGSLLKY